LSQLRTSTLLARANWELNKSRILFLRSFQQRRWRHLAFALGALTVVAGALLEFQLAVTRQLLLLAPPIQGKSSAALLLQMQLMTTILLIDLSFPFEISAGSSGSVSSHINDKNGSSAIASSDFPFDVT
jgi:hypothetical protein